MKHERNARIIEHTFTLTEEEAWRLCIQLSDFMEDPRTGWTDKRYAGTPAYELRELLGSRNIV